ncbi:MAG: ATPase [Elusimicrobia bacterium]|nr:ATPase [Elusimicrobiota bacterium]
MPQLLTAFSLHPKQPELFLGIDIGASAAKAVLLNGDRKVLSSYTGNSGVDFALAAEDARSKCLAAAGVADKAGFTVATGYGRRNAAFADETRTEISCHAKGGYFHYPRECTIVDIGGQDSKVIRLDAVGHPVSFKMNRKCAAGTGALLEEIAPRLSVSLEELEGLARRAQSEIELGSFCAVFTKTEILAKIAQGVKLQDLVKGAFGSIIKRVMEMDPLEGAIVMTGGVIAHNPYLGEMFEKKLGRPLFIPPAPQSAGALGAALFAAEITAIKRGLQR